MKPPSGTVSRYTSGARANHWLNAIILILLALSGMSLFHPSLFFLSDLFGGGVWARILHPWLGVALIFTFAGLFIRFWRYNIWNKTDTQWLNRIRDVLAPGGLFIARFNSVRDVNFGATGHPEIEPRYHLVDGQPKRFFDRADVRGMLGHGWRIHALRHRYTYRYTTRKALWEVVCSKDGT